MLYDVQMPRNISAAVLPNHIDNPCIQKIRNDLGTLQNLLYDMAGGEENFLEKNLLAPYETIAEKLTAP